jgi:hypothetical protein
VGAGVGVVLEPDLEPEVLVDAPVVLFDAVLDALEVDAVGVVPAGVVSIGTRG